VQSFQCPQKFALDPVVEGGEHDSLERLEGRQFLVDRFDGDLRRAREREPIGAAAVEDRRRPYQ
jgi:hypothetical protein